jgi:long-chain acyl-CoA synthetase
MNIARHLERSAFFFPDRPVLSAAGREITYQDLNDRAGSVATTLQTLGVAPGDRIGLYAPNSPEWLASYFGVLKIGAVAFTFSAQMPTEELTRLARPLGLRYLFSTEDKRGALNELKDAGFLEGLLGPAGDPDWSGRLARNTGPFPAVDRHRADAAAVLFTGGTTGFPKGVLLSHENITVSSHNVAYAERSTEQDRALCFLPFNHVFGQMHIMNATIFSGGCLELLPAFDLDRVLEILALGRVTKFFAVPTIYIRLLNLEGLKERLSGVRYCFSAAASLAAETVREWQSRTGLTIFEGYGLTETASAVTYNHFRRHRIGSVGETVPGVEVQIRDPEGRLVQPGREGEICIRGRNVMTGYLDNPRDTETAFWPDDWFRSGDIGYLDQDGYLFIVDRLKDMVITGGENVYPREVEEVLYGHRDIQECAVIGVPDKEWGERVIAFVVLKPNTELNPEDLKAYLKKQLAPFKIPKNFIPISELPRSAAGKILKRQLKQEMARKKE